MDERDKLPETLPRHSIDLVRRRTNSVGLADSSREALSCRSDGCLFEAGKVEAEMRSQQLPPDFLPLAAQPA
jgi:hypothetical protein